MAGWKVGNVKNNVTNIWIFERSLLYIITKGSLKQYKPFSRMFTISNECRPMLLLNNGESQVKTDQLTPV